MAFKNETPLRGWKEIMPAIGFDYNKPYDKIRAKNSLDEKGLLKYENGWPILMYSEWTAWFKRGK